MIHLAPCEAIGCRRRRPEARQKGKRDGRRVRQAPCTFEPRLQFCQVDASAAPGIVAGIIQQRHYVHHPVLAKPTTTATTTSECAIESHPKKTKKNKTTSTPYLPSGITGCVPAALYGCYTVRMRLLNGAQFAL